MSLYDRVKAIPGGGRALAASRLRRAVLGALHKAFRNSPLESQAELAKRLKVRRSAVNQVLRGDGNVQISTLAEYLYEMGYELDVTLVRAGELRAAALDDRTPTPAFTSASSSASAQYGSYSLQGSQSSLICTQASPWGGFTGIDANIVPRMLVLLSSYRELSGGLPAVPVYEPIDLSE